MPKVRGVVSLTDENEYHAELEDTPDDIPDEITAQSEDEIRDQIKYYLKGSSHLHDEEYEAEVLSNISYYERLPDDIKFFGWLHYRLEGLGSLIGLIYIIGVLALSLVGVANEQHLYYSGVGIVIFLIILRIWWFVFFQFKEKPENVTLTKLGVLRVDRT